MSKKIINFRKKTAECCYTCKNMKPFGLGNFKCKYTNIDDPEVVLYDKDGDSEPCDLAYCVCDLWGQE